MAKSRSTVSVGLPRSSKSSIPANEETETERSTRLGASGEAAGDIDAIIADRLDEGEIRERAYAIWLAEGQPDGREMEHWLRARQEHAKKA